MNKIVRQSKFTSARQNSKSTDFLSELNSTISYRALEPRIAFDGAAAATVIAAADQQSDQSSNDGTSPSTGEPAPDTSDASPLPAGGSGAVPVEGYFEAAIFKIGEAIDLCAEIDPDGQLRW